MNCIRCGRALPPGAAACPYCGAPVTGPQNYTNAAPQGDGYGYGAPQAPNGGYSPDAYGSAGYPGGFGPTAYPQANYSPDANATGGGQGYEGYPKGYRQVYGRYDAPGRERNDFFTAMGNLPHVLREVFADPGETLHGMMDRNDRYTGGVVAGMALLLTFLAAILLSRGMVASLYGGLTGLLGTKMAGDTASLNQGLNYIVGKMAAPVGAIAALCQLFAMVAATVAALTYLCGFRKVRFSFLLLSNLTAILTIPSIAASLLSMPLSLLSPWLGGVALLAGEVASYVLLAALLSWITGLSQPDLVTTKIAVIGAAELAKILFFWLVGGALAGNVLHTVMGLVNTLGNLI